MRLSTGPRGRRGRTGERSARRRGRRSRRGLARCRRRRTRSSTKPRRAAIRDRHSQPVTWSPARNPDPGRQTT
ncbi:MAG: hypothetical protein GEU78_12430 [Actinobacteria bacterium]|nr:hypothetical protein [Actinomycetota bacterium]